MDHVAMLTIIGLAVALLWFVDELLSFRNIKKYSIIYNRPPLIAWLFHHHARGLIYIKMVFYVIFMILAAELLKKYFLYFHLFTLTMIAVYLIFDIKVQTGNIKWSSHLKDFELFYYYIRFLQQLQYLVILV